MSLYSPPTPRPTPRPRSLHGRAGLAEGIRRFTEMQALENAAAPPKANQPTSRKHRTALASHLTPSPHEDTDTTPDAYIRHQMEDPRYWKSGETDDAHRDRVTQMWKAAYPGTYEPGSWGRNSTPALSAKDLAERFQPPQSDAPRAQLGMTQVAQAGSEADLGDLFGLSDWDQVPPAQSQDGFEQPIPAPPDKQDIGAEAPDERSTDERLRDLQAEWGIELDTATAPPREGGNRTVQRARRIQDWAREQTGETPTVPENLKEDVVEILEDMKGLRNMSDMELREFKDRVEGLGGGGADTAVLRNSILRVYRAFHERPWAYPPFLSDEKIESFSQQFDPVVDIAGGIAGASEAFGKAVAPMDPGFFGTLLDYTTVFGGMTEDIYRKRIERLRREQARRHGPSSGSSN